MKGRFIGIATAFLLVICALAAFSQEATLARLDGAAAVLESEVSGFQAAQACYGEGAATSRKAAFMRLLEAAIADKAMRDSGAAALGEADFKAEAERIDKETRAPDILACIKDALGDRYVRVFVRPTLIESRLRILLMKDAKIQAGPRAKAEGAIARIKKGSSMEGAAKEFGLEYSSMTYTEQAPEGGMVRGRMPWSPFEKDFIEKNLKDLKPGELKGEAIESDFDFRLVRLLSTDAKGWRFETAFARKLSQEDWLKSRPRMKLEISDEALRSWINGINGNPRLVATEVQ
jgi:hypothetical protein